jgi:thioredoxin reductase (NADPH)
LYKIGIKQAKNLEIDVKEEEVFNIKKENEVFFVETENNEYEAKSVIIATGNKKLRPNIKGVLDFEGKGISYCAICDGFFYRKKSVVVIGSGNYAISEAKELKNVTPDVKILTNGLKLEGDTDILVDERKIKEIGGEDRISYVLFEDGEKIECKGVFIALGEAGGADFAKKLGIYMEKDSIVVDENLKTTVPGVYAAGNVVGGLLQINKAVYEGAVAGLEVIKYIKESKK